jgi:hypothetical protein
VLQQWIIDMITTLGIQFGVGRVDEFSWTLERVANEAFGQISLWKLSCHGFGGMAFYRVTVNIYTIATFDLRSASRRFASSFSSRPACERDRFDQLLFSRDW